MEKEETTTHFPAIMPTASFETFADTADTTVSTSEETTVAQASDEDITILRKSDTDLPTVEPQNDDNHELVATATPDGQAMINVTQAEAAQFVTRNELKQLLQEAYLKGRNEAVHAKMMADSSLAASETAASAEIAEDVAHIFRTRRSVWPQ